MGTDVQALLLKIDANTELARRELRKMDGDFDTFARKSEMAAGNADAAFASFGKSASLAKATIIGFAAGVGIEGVVAFGRAVLNAADDLDAAAEKAGIGVERYQTLKESLRALEVEGDKVDKIFQRLTDTLGAVQGGTAGAGVEAVLDKMGIKSRILNGEIDTTDELLDAIAASAGKFNTQAEFTAAVVDLVGRKLGVDLANALKDGGIALKAGEQAFTDAGGVVDKEYIKRLADANEAVDKFTSNAKSRVLIWAGETITALDRVVDKYGALETVLLALSSASPVAMARAAVKLAIGGPIGLSNRELDGLNDKFPIPGTRPAVTRPVIAPRPDRTSPSRTKSGAVKPSLSPAQQRAESNFSPGIDSNISLSVDSIVSGLGGSLVNLDNISARLDEIELQAIDLGNVEIFDPQSIALGRDFLNDLSFGIADALAGATSLGDALTKTFERAGLSLLQSGILNFLSGGKEGVSFGDAFKGLSSIFSGLGFAGGGSPPVGKFSMVGERGPELFMPRVPGTIIPNHMLGGGGTIQQFDLRGAVVTEQLYAQMQAIGVRAAQAGAIGGAKLAGANSARLVRRTAR